jgi:hypothetical protein
MERNKVTEEDARLAEDLIAKVRTMEPILKNPEGLTEDIMNSIREIPEQDTSGITAKSRKLQVINMVQRLLAAASVCLFLLFGYEEYVVVDKISLLEKQNTAISQSAQYKSALNLKKAINIFLSDPGMKAQYKELKTKQVSLPTVFKAMMYVDMAFVDPGAIKFPEKTDYHSLNSAFISLIKQFDSTQNNIRR